MAANEEVEMMASKKIDILIAKLMGWRWVDGTSIPYSTFMSPEDQAKSGGEVVAEPTDSAGIGLDNVPYYSTDIGAAWSIFDAFKEYAIEIRNSNKPGMASWTCYIGTFLGTGETPMMAICRAALAAVKGEA